MLSMAEPSPPSSSGRAPPSPNGSSRRTPVIRLHGAPTLSPRAAPKKQHGRRASEFYYREPEYLAPPRSTVSTPPPGRKRSASLPHVRSPSPVPPPLSRRGQRHRAAEEEDEDEQRSKEESTMGKLEEEGEQRRGRPPTTDRKAFAVGASRCPGRRGRPSLDLSACQPLGHITLGSHLDSEIARRRHSVAVASSPGASLASQSKAEEPAARAGERSPLTPVSSVASKEDAPSSEESWLEEEDSSDEDLQLDSKPPTALSPDSSPSHQDT